MIIIRDILQFQRLVSIKVATESDHLRKIVAHRDLLAKLLLMVEEIEGHLVKWAEEEGQNIAPIFEHVLTRDDIRGPI